ncbi:MAG: GNAT family N-acetyltransferase [Planctomycetota bacterium JB042]
METRFLADDDLDAVHATFLEAFSDYVVPIAPDRDQLGRMLRQRSADLALSVGAFDGGRMAGVSATGRRGDEAYVIFTGVVPAFRGRRLAGAMFDRLLPALAEAGVRRLSLEVIRGNDRAVAAYRRAGFVVERDLACFTLARDDVVPADPPDGVTVTRRAAAGWPEWRRFRDWAPSWQHAEPSIERTEGEVVLLEAVERGRAVGAAVVLVEGAVLAGLAVAPAARRRGVGSALLAAAAAEAEPLRILNVDASSAADAAFYPARGARPLLVQHEMARRV